MLEPTALSDGTKKPPPQKLGGGRRFSVFSARGSGSYYGKFGVSLAP